MVFMLVRYFLISTLIYLASPDVDPIVKVRNPAKMLIGKKFVIEENWGKSVMRYQATFLDSGKVILTRKWPVNYDTLAYGEWRYAHDTLEILYAHLYYTGQVDSTGAKLNGKLIVSKPEANDQTRTWSMVTDTAETYINKKPSYINLMRR